jgi:hypothetical protein
VTEDYVAGLFWNKNTNNPNAWTYDPDPSRRVWNDQKQPDTQLRMSWQATPRQKVGFTAYNTTYCFCPTDASATLSWEAGTRQSYPVQRLLAGDYTLPLTARVLIEGNGQFFDSQSNRVPWDGLARGMVPVQEQNTGMKYRSPDSFRVQKQRVYTFRGALSYVTGAHAFKFGGSNRQRPPQSDRIRLLTSQLSAAKRGAQPDHRTSARVLAGEREVRSRAVRPGSMDA